VDGRRGVRQTWPAAMVAGSTFAVGQFVTSNYISVELTDIVASLLSTGAMVAFLQLWQPGEPLRFFSRNSRHHHCLGDHVDQRNARQSGHLVGMRTGGDVSKAIACGADAVMMGSPLARATEAVDSGAAH